MPEQVTVLVYGSFTDPKTGLNFFLIRYPEGRVPWSKKMAPALNRMIREWFSAEQRAQAQRERWLRGDSDAMFWQVEGIEDDAWETTKPTRLVWDGSAFVECPRA